MLWKYTTLSLDSPERPLVFFCSTPFSTTLALSVHIALRNLKMSRTLNNSQNKYGRSGQKSTGKERGSGTDKKKYPPSDLKIPRLNCSGKARRLAAHFNSHCSFKAVSEATLSGVDRTNWKKNRSGMSWDEQQNRETWCFVASRKKILKCTSNPPVNQASKVKRKHFSGSLDTQKD